ncbi:MAG: hypothetical protein ACYCTE_16655 [Acidimicrobiales bacterium]
MVRRLRWRAVQRRILKVFARHLVESLYAKSILGAVGVPNTNAVTTARRARRSRDRRTTGAGAGHR